MKTVADILGVARSNLAEKARRDQRASSSKSPLPRGPYAKPDDLVFLPAIRGQISTEIHAKKPQNAPLARTATRSFLPRREKSLSEGRRRARLHVMEIDDAEGYHNR
jgi:hypothetical protein